MEVKIRIERKSLMSGIVPVKKCTALSSRLIGFKSIEYNITEKEILFSINVPANFSSCLVGNLTDTIRLYLDGYDVDKDLNNISIQRDKPIRL